MYWKEAFIAAFLICDTAGFYRARVDAGRASDFDDYVFSAVIAERRGSQVRLVFPDDSGRPLYSYDPERNRVEPEKSSVVALARTRRAPLGEGIIVADPLVAGALLGGIPSLSILWNKSAVGAHILGKAKQVKGSTLTATLVGVVTGYYLGYWLGNATRLPQPRDARVRRLLRDDRNWVTREEALLGTGLELVRTVAARMPNQRRLKLEAAADSIFERHRQQLLAERQVSASTFGALVDLYVELGPSAASALRRQVERDAWAGLLGVLLPVFAIPAALFAIIRLWEHFRPQAGQ